MVDRTSLQTIIYDAILIALNRRGFLYLALPITPCALTFPSLETSCKPLRRREIHTRLRLNVCALNYYLFKIGSKPSPECLCGFEIESINHYFLHCPLFAAPRLKLLSSAAHILADRWNAISELQLLRLFLTGSSQLTENENIGIFHSVQCFIKESGRFALVEP